MRIFLIVGLLSYLTWSRLATSFFRSFEYIFGIYGYSPRTIASASEFSDSPLNGYFNAQSSYNNTPNDQMSDLNEYG